jgi:hypothetical protein
MKLIASVSIFSIMQQLMTRYLVSSNQQMPVRPIKIYLLLMIMVLLLLVHFKAHLKEQQIIQRTLALLVAVV